MNDFVAFEKKIIGTKHKYINFQIGMLKGKAEECNIFQSNFNWNRRVDHAGLNIDLNIWNFYFLFQIYDNRHWCYDCDAFASQKCYDEKHDI